MECEERSGTTVGTRPWGGSGFGFACCGTGLFTAMLVSGVVYLEGRAYVGSGLRSGSVICLQKG